MILITGASGLVGRQLVEQLTAARWPVRVYVPPRRGGRPPHIAWLEGVELVAGGLDDEQGLHQAMQGVHTVFHLASAQWWGNRRDLEQVDVQGTRNVVAASRAARIGRLYYLSQLGAEPSSAYTLLRIKGQVEALIRNSGIAYTIVRCGVIFGPDDRFVNGIAMLLRTNPLVFFQPGDGQSLLHPLYVSDLVRALQNSLESIDLVDQTIEIGGAEYITYNEMIRTVMRVSGAKRIIVSLPPYVLRNLNRTVTQVARRWPMTPQWFDILASNRTAKLGNLYDYCGVRPVRFEDTLLTYMPRRHYLAELLRFMSRRPV
ncbi:MAG TPA: NAD(P)H-binding protein [Aggregatilineaceae bacterium]|jgi:NADH dehydrogenase|nr:NAD(P)H-binding protein [Aggregatilineaceae bacterium]